MHAAWVLYACLSAQLHDCMTELVGGCTLRRSLVVSGVLASDLPKGRCCLFAFSLVHT